jgi:hypothetical protein
VPPPLQIKIDQSGKPPGVPGVAREDLALGTPVQLTAVGGPFLSYLWTIEFKPVDVVAGNRSSAALTSATTNITLVEPIDKAGTYRVGIAVDAGFGLGAREQDVSFKTFYAGPTLNSDPTKYPRRTIATGETDEHNAPDAIDPGGNKDGWARERTRWDAAAAAGGAGAGVVPPTPSTLLERGTAGEGYAAFFAPVQSGIAASGVLRLTNGALPAVAVPSVLNPGSGSLHDVVLLGFDNDDGVIVGDSVNALSVTLKVAYSSAQLHMHGTTGSSWFDPNGIYLSGGAGGFVKVTGTRFVLGLNSPSSLTQFVIAPHTYGLGAGSFAIDWDAEGSNPDYTISGALTLLASTNVQAGGRYAVTIRQGAGGPWTVTWDSTFHFGNFNPLVTAQAGAVDIFEFIGDAGGVLRCVGATTGRLTPSVTFTVDFTDWSGAGGATFFDYQITLPVGARLASLAIVSNWTGVDDPGHNAVQALLGLTPGGSEIQNASLLVSVSGGSFPFASNAWTGPGQQGYPGIDLGGQTLHLRIDTFGSYALSAATQGHFVLKLFYFFG